MIKRAYIEILNTCNLSCSFCRKNSRPPVIMSCEAFSAVLEQIRPVTSYIYLHVQGEPLMHPQLDRIMDLCDRADMKVHLVTNATFLYKFSGLYKHPSLRKISFSLQSVEYQKDIDIRSYLDTIISFCRKASELGHPYCEIRFWRDDQTDMKNTAECLSVLHDQFVFRETGRTKNWSILPGVYVDTSNAFTWPDISGTHEDSTGTCLGGLMQIAVLADGTVCPCCLDADGNIPLGNIFHQSLAQILQSERYLRLTQGFRSHRLTEELCRKCQYRHRFD